MRDATQTAFVQVYGARNAVLGLVALSFLVLRMIKPMALLFTVAALLPPLDAWVIVSRIGVGGELIRHAVIFLVLALTSMALWRLGRTGS